MKGRRMMSDQYQTDGENQKQRNMRFLENPENMRGIIESIPGGIASYVIEHGTFIPVFYSDGVLDLSGHTREELDELIHGDAFNIIYEKDRDRVMAAVMTAVLNGGVVDICCRTRHKNGNLVWIHLSGRRIGPFADTMKFYAVFTGMPAEAQLFRDIADQTADGIYVINKKNHEILYANESKELFHLSSSRVGQKCYMAIHGKQSPCEYCAIRNRAGDGRAFEIKNEETGGFYSIRCGETSWSGIPAYVIFVRNVTEEVRVRREKERLEQYFENVVKYLPGGVSVARYLEDGSMKPEFWSEGFARMLGMSHSEVWRLYGEEPMGCVYPEDVEMVRKRFEAFMAGEDSHCEMVYRLVKGDKSILWVKNSISVLRGGGGENRVYSNYHDITKEWEEQEQLRRQYKELIMQHYQTSGPDVLVLGHCSITQNRILEIDDQTDSDLLTAFTSVRDTFFTGIASLIVDRKERQVFLDTFLNKPALAAYERGDKELVLNCFIKLPKETRGRYARFWVNLVQEPNTGDITGILTVTDVTEQVVADRILHHLSAAGYDFVIDLDLVRDHFTMLAGNKHTSYLHPEGSHSAQTAYMLENAVVPKDRKQYKEALEPACIYRRLKEEGPYTFSFTMFDQKGNIRTKNMMVSAVDLRIGRVCLVRTDITDSVREQQGLLNVMAYTFETLAFIKIDEKRLIMHTRRTVLENLPPFVVEDYDDASVDRLLELSGLEERHKEAEFCLETILKRLEEKPSGYDFVLSLHSAEGTRYKQFNVLWGDEAHKTVSMVQADVTDMLAAEHRAKETLKDALAQAEEASRAKSDFLSSMSHDIRTPMNAIIGMTELAFVHLNEKEKLKDYLEKISFSSKHLLNLINDILDMSKIERAKITLNREGLVLPGLVKQLADMLAPQAKSEGLVFLVHVGEIRHPYFYGDSLRINQILINILGNAIKFTKPGGTVKFQAEELPDAGGEGKARYRFTVSDTGLGMSEELQKHIFEPFTRSSKSEQVEGTGLGLSITRGLVDLMGGEISVKSRENQGSRFQVELEFDIVPDGEAVAWKEDDRTTETPDEKLLEGRRFLVAEDNAINMEILCELLQMYGAGFVTKTDGAQAVNEFLETPPGTYDAILMDVQMPEMNGYEATRAIRGAAREDAGTIPIIAMTANAFAEDIQMAREAGMTAHVAKPIDMRVLIRVLAGALDVLK